MRGPVARRDGGRLVLSMFLVGRRNDLKLKDIIRETESLRVEVEVAFIWRDVTSLIVLPVQVGPLELRCLHTVLGLTDILIDGRVCPKVAATWLGGIADITRCTAPGTI